MLGRVDIEREVDVLREAAGDVGLLRLYRVPLPSLQKPIRLLP